MSGCFGRGVEKAVRLFEGFVAKGCWGGWGEGQELLGFASRYWENYWNRLLGEREGIWRVGCGTIGW